MATAGFASAQGVEVSGAAEMGYGGGGAGIAEGLYQSIDVFFDMTGETDNGLTFGASIDLDDALDQARGGFSTNDLENQFADYTVFISGAFGTLTMGDTDGALDFVITENTGNPGSIGDDETTHSGYDGGFLDGAGNNGQILRYDNTFGDFTVPASVETGDVDGERTGFAIGGEYALGFSGGTATFGLGYQEADGPGRGGDIYAASVSVVLDAGFSAGIMYAAGDDFAGGNYEHYQLSAGYEFGPFALGANYGEFDGAGSPAISTDPVNGSGFGIAASYDLGGGAALHAGYGSGNLSEDIYSFGLAMSF